MERRTFWVTLSILAAVIMILTAAIIRQDRQRETWDISIRMANAGIEWTGAGYNGIYRK